MQKINTTAGFSLRADTGFSLPELMVVVVIIGLLAGLALPRLRAFIARGRQAEAKTSLSHIHTLQISYQDLNDRFTNWSKGATFKVGKGGVCDDDINPSPQCGPSVDCNVHANKTACDADTGNSCSWSDSVDPGAYELGFKPLNCESLRYGYWILRGVESATGREKFLAIAYAPSDTSHRIYPTCTGKKGSRPAIKHPLQGKDGLGDLTTGAPPDGDWQTVTEDKVFAISDIIPICEDL